MIDNNHDVSKRSAQLRRTKIISKRLVAHSQLFQQSAKIKMRLIISLHTREWCVLIVSVLHSARVHFAQKEEREENRELNVSANAIHFL